MIKGIEIVGKDFFKLLQEVKWSETGLKATLTLKP